MADTPSPPLSPPSSPPEYWCYHCDKRVSVETLPDQPDLICIDCKFGFVESLPSTTATTASAVSPPPPSPPPYPPSRTSDDATLGSQFLQVLRLLAQVAREDDAPPPPPPPPRPLNPSDPTPSDDDFLRIEIDGWDHHTENENENENENEDHRNEENDDDDDEEDEDDEDVRSVEIEGHSDEEFENEEDIRRRRRDMLRIHLRDIATRARTRTEGRNRILDWAEILMGLEDNSIEFRFEMPETDRYIGNPGDYVDAAEYEALLQNLAEAEGRRGAPPAAKSALENLRTVEIKSVDESYVCAVCKDAVEIGQVVKEMPCGHGYHGDCIVPWLGARNSCPVCRFELPTDDPDYEQERKKRSGGGGASSGSSAFV